MKPLGVYYYKYPNFGDLLNEEIMKKLFALPFTFEEFTTADLIVIGSILDRIVSEGKIGGGDKKKQKSADQKKKLHVWGTGLMYAYEQPSPVIRPVRVHALRGELTRRQFSEMLGKDISCTLADPGLLSSLLVPPAGEKRWKVGIIPHYVDSQDEVFRQMETYYPDALRINVQDKTETVLEQISACETVLSTSLHGLIVADAYGVPNCWCVNSDRILGNGYKYHDHFSAFGGDREPFDLRSGKLPDLDKDCVNSFQSYNEVTIKQKELISCFPYRNRMRIADRIRLHRELKAVLNAAER